MLKQKYDKPYKCNHDSTIFFGKYKNQPHSVLIDDLKYCEWLMSTEEGFAEPTKEYINTYIKF